MAEKNEKLEREKEMKLLSQKEPDLIVMTPKCLKKLIDKNIQEHLRQIKLHRPLL